MAKHAMLAPSSAYRWMRCPGSVQASKDLPDNAGEAAEEGTFIHQVAAEALAKAKEAPC